MSINGSFHWDMNFTQQNVGLIKGKEKNDTTLLLSAISQKVSFPYLEAIRNMDICFTLQRMEIVPAFLLTKQTLLRIFQPIQQPPVQLVVCY